MPISSHFNSSFLPIASNPSQRCSTGRGTTRLSLFRVLFLHCFIFPCLLFTSFFFFFFFIVLGFCFSGRGIYILYEDVKSCPYEDVHVLWSILVESHTPLPSKNEVSFAQSWMWESFSYLQFSFLSSSSVQKNIYDVFTYIKKFSLFSGLLNHFNISSHEYSDLWMFIQHFLWL